MKIEIAFIFKIFQRRTSASNLGGHLQRDEPGRGAGHRQDQGGGAQGLQHQDPGHCPTGSSEMMKYLRNLVVCIVHS